MLTAAKEPPRSHLLGTESRVGDGQVDIVAHGKEQDGEHGSQQDAQSCLVAFLHADALVQRCEHDVGEGCQRKIVGTHTAPQHVVLRQVILYRFCLVVERSAWP